MISMHGVPSSLIARNESWVRKQAQALARHLPSNVEKADLIQAGLIAVAQATLTFEWEGDRDCEEAKDAFVRYARMRVKGAMLDELRQMDYLGRAQRRKVKVIQIARERFRSAHGAAPGLAELSELCGMSMDEVSLLDQADQTGRMKDSSYDHDEEHHETHHAATPAEEVEARVDTAIVMRRLERFFARLPERDRQVIDSYLGVGMTPVQLAESLQVTPSRVSQLYKSVVQRIASHFGHHRSIDRLPGDPGGHFAEMVEARESELQRSFAEGPWGELMEEVLSKPLEKAGGEDSERMNVTGDTRWG